MTSLARRGAISAARQLEAPPEALSQQTFGPGMTQNFGSTDGQGGVNTNTYTHPAGTPDLIIGFVCGYRTSGAMTDAAMSYGGIAMSPIGEMAWGNGTTAAVNASFGKWFGLLDPPEGPQTVQPSWSGWGAASPWIVANTIGFVGASGWAGPSVKTDPKSGTTFSQTIASAVGEIVLHIAMHEGLSTSSVYPADANQTVLQLLDGGNGRGMLRTAPGAASVNFTATRISNSDHYESAIRILPAA